MSEDIWGTSPWETKVKLWKKWIQIFFHMLYNNFEVGFWSFFNGTLLKKEKKIETLMKQCNIPPTLWVLSAHSEDEWSGRDCAKYLDHITNWNKTEGKTWYSSSLGWPPFLWRVCLSLWLKARHSSLSACRACGQTETLATLEHARAPENISDAKSDMHAHGSTQVCNWSLWAPPLLCFVKISILQCHLYSILRFYHSIFYIPAVILGFSQ